MNNPDIIKTIASFKEFRIKEKGSLFIGQAHPVETEEEILKHIQSTRKEFYDATHHCYASLLGADDFKYSDDGEPSGTAGIRILNAIQHFELKYVLVIVIRYFGGTKLGVGPLGKAYYDSAHGVLSECSILEKIACDTVEIFYDYAQTSLVHHLIGNFRAKITESEFSPSPKIKCIVESHLVKEFASQLHNNSSGKIDVGILCASKYLPKTAGKMDL